MTIRYVGAKPQTTFLAAIALLLMGWTALAGQKQAPPVAVFVTSVGAKDGFTDPNKDNRDSVKDLQDALRRYAKSETIVLENPRNAAITLVVQQRETATMTTGFFGPSRDRVLHVVFTFRDLTTDLRASAAGGSMTSGGAWTAAAAKLAKQVRDWVQQNREKIDAQ